MVKKKDEFDKENGRALERDQDPKEQGMNREMKRMLAKREGAADRLRPKVRRKRAKPMQFIREIKGELARVAWPTRKEVVTYTIVVMVTVTVVMVLVAGLDYVALKGVLALIGVGE